MLKKSLIVGAAVLLLGVLSHGLWWHHAAAAWTGVSDWADESTSVDYDIKVAESMLKDLDPEIRHNMHLIAKQEVQVEKMERELELLRQDVAQREADIARLNADLNSSQVKFVYAGRTYTKQQVQTDAINRFQKLEAQEKLLAEKESILSARKARLSAAQEKLVAMENAKTQLELEIENLKAEHESVQIAQAESEYAFDDSALSRAKEQLEKARTKVRVQQKLLNQADTGFAEEIPLNDEPAPSDAEADLLSRINERFGSQSEADLARASD